MGFCTACGRERIGTSQSCDGCGAEFREPEPEAEYGALKPWAPARSGSWASGFSTAWSFAGASGPLPPSQVTRPDLGIGLLDSFLPAPDPAGEAWPGLSDARWDRIARLSYRANAQGLPEEDADPRIAEPLRNTAAAVPNLWPLWETLGWLPVLAIRGAQSDILSAATLARMQRTKPDLKVLSVANRGHAPLHYRQFGRRPRSGRFAGRRDPRGDDRRRAPARTGRPSRVAGRGKGSGFHDSRERSLQGELGCDRRHQGQRNVGGGGPKVHSVGAPPASASWRAPFGSMDDRVKRSPHSPDCGTAHGSIRGSPASEPSAPRTGSRRIPRSSAVDDQSGRPRWPAGAAQKRLA